MSLSLSLRWLKRILFVGLAVAGSVAAVGYLRWAMKIDPFARYRLGEKNANLQVGIRLEDVAVKSWTDGKLSLACDVGRVDVLRDRQHMNFYQVRNGLYQGKNGKFRFSGPQANFNAGFQLLQVGKGARVWNNDLNLMTEGFVYRQKIGKLSTIGTVKGKLFSGQVEAQSFVYFPEEELYEAGPIVWEGKPGKDFQEVATTEGSKPWKIAADRMKRAPGDLEIWTNGEATDGEVIVKAPTLERNIKTDVLTCKGRVQYFGKRANLICDQAVIYRKEKRAVLSGNVTMLIKPKDQEKLEVVEMEPFRPLVPEEIAKSRPAAPPVKSDEEKRQDEELRGSKSAKKYPTTVGADRIEYWYTRGQRRAVITGRPQAIQEFPNGRWRRMWTTKAFYDDEKETLRLESAAGKKDTRIMTSIGDDLVALWFLTSTKESGEDEWEGEGVEGTVISDDDDVNRSNRPPTRTGPPPALRGPIGRGRIS